MVPERSRDSVVEVLVVTRFLPLITLTRCILEDVIDDFDINTIKWGDFNALTFSKMIQFETPSYLQAKDHSSSSKNNQPCKQTWKS